MVGTLVMAPKSVTFRCHDHLVSVLFGDLLSQSYNITFSMFLYLVAIGFLQESAKRTLRTARACFGRLTLPVVHKSLEAFRKSFLTAFEFGQAAHNLQY